MDARTEQTVARAGEPDPAGLLDGRYRVGPVLARGGMSTVHRGLDTRLDRPVAIKIMDPRLAGDPAFRARFDREARSAARIDHRHVVGVFDRGAWTTPAGEPTLFLVMELVEGGTLRDLLRRRGAVGVPVAVAVLDQVLAGLAQAHRLGLVHRDVKPENVLVAPDGTLKVADFGLVTAAAEAGMSHAGMILGTMAYLSPEQVATGQADPRSDVYAAGILAYELLTGTPPYTGDNPLSVAYRHVNADVPAPSAVAGDVPPELDALVRRATSRDPAVRPADAGAFLEELHRLAERLRVPRVPVPVPPLDEQDTVPATWDALPAGPSGTRALAQDRPGGGTAVAPRPDHLADHRIARRRSRRVFTVWIVVLLLLGLAVGSTAWWLGSGRWTAMPAVVGLDRVAAERLLTNADLAYSVTEQHHDAVAADRIAAADPATGARLLRGTSVTLTVSTGRPVVPAVAPGTAVDAAQQAVKAAGLTPVTSAAAADYSASVPQGAVVRTEPAAGAALPIGGQVTLVVSRGPQPPPQVSVPFVIGSRLADARTALTAAGLTVQVQQGLPWGTPRETSRVVAQDLTAGDTVRRGSTITLTVF